MKAAEVEKARFEAQRTIDAGKTLASRRALGQFATPPGLAAEIAAETAPFLSWSRGSAPVSMLEPSAGTGAFLSAFLSNPEIRIEAVEAVECDPDFHDAGKRLWRGFPCRYRLADFTRLAPDRLHDLVVANPPYVRHHGIEPADKKRLAERVKAETGIAVSGLAGLYCHFLLLSLKWMKPGAVGVWLVPSEWMSVNYGSALRRFFTQRVRLLRVHRFDASDIRFSDALVSSCVVWFANESPGNETEFSGGPDLAHPSERRTVSLEALRRSDKWPPPADAEDGSGTEPPRVKDFFTIRRGIATGDNSFFVLSEEQAAERNLSPAYLKPILPSPRNLKTDRVESDSRGVPSNAPRLFLFDCTGADPSTLPAPDRRYLASGEQTTGRKKLCASRPRWFDQEQRRPACILCSYMGRGSGAGAPVRFILNESSAIAANSFLLLYAKGGLERRLADHPEEREEVWRMLRAIPAEEFRRAGRSYGGGLQKMEPRELGNLVCRDLGNWFEALSPHPFRQDEAGNLLLFSPPGRYDGRRIGNAETSGRNRNGSGSPCTKRKKRPKGRSAAKTGKQSMGSAT